MKCYIRYQSAGSTCTLVVCDIFTMAGLDKAIKEFGGHPIKVSPSTKNLEVDILVLDS